MVRKWLGWVTLTASIGLGVVGCRSRAEGEPDPEPPTGARSIPLAPIYSTTPQEGVTLVRRGGQEPYQRYLELLRQEARSGASNILLVCGDDFETAMRSTWGAFGSCASASAPVGPNDGKKESKTLWLAALVGIAGSEPPAWLVKGAERKDNVIRLRIVQPERSISTCDIHHYFVWIPLGKVEAGTYALELFDEGREEVTLMRRVRVPAE